MRHVPSTNPRPSERTTLRKERVPFSNMSAFLYTLARITFLHRSRLGEMLDTRSSRIV
jgi:hypothetical protein